MKIAVRSERDSGWREVPSKNYQIDESIQELIRQTPELISVEDIEPGGSSLKVCIKRPSANGMEDDGGFIGIDDTGRITIVECRIPNDSSVGKALEYAAGLWEMSYEQFDRKVFENEGKSLVELMSEQVPAEKWSEEKFRNAVSSCLRRGNFRLIMIIQNMTDELRRTIKFLGARGPFSFDTYAVEIQHFFEGQTEIIVPNIKSFASASDAIWEKRSATGREAMPSRKAPFAFEESSAHAPSFPDSTEPSISSSHPPVNSSHSSEPVIGQVADERGIHEHVIQPDADQTADKNKQKETVFFTKCQESVDQRAAELIKRLYTFSAQVADDIMWWGSGGAGAFNFILTEDQLTVFIIDASGRIMFNFSEWQREPSYKNLLPQFIEKLRNIPALRRQKGDYTQWSDFSVDDFFASDNDLSRFEEAVRFLKEELGRLAPA